MTWMTVPLAPLAVYGIVRTFRADDVASQVWLAAPLAALWWAHSPVALWFTFIAAASQIVRLAGVRRSLAPFRRAILGAAIFAVLAQYPFVSLAALRDPAAPAPAEGAPDMGERIAGFVSGAFPAAVLPLSDHARELSDVQLGYGLWTVLLAASAAAVTSRRRDLPVLLASAAVLLVLLLPVPGLNPFLWRHMPGEVARITYYWPMQRFYLIAAALLAAAGQIACDAAAARPRMRRALGAVLLVGCLWSLWEARQFLRAAGERTATVEATARDQRPENLMLMNHAYGLFPRLPAYFSNGVLDPRSQARLLSPSGAREPLSAGSPAGLQSWTGTLDANPGIVDLAPSLHLAFGRRYRLSLEFAHPGAPGILQLAGRSLFREYSLPTSGEALAFGDAPGGPHELDLWTSDPAGDDVAVRFIPMREGARAAGFLDFGSYSLREVDPAREPVEVTSLVPLRATVRADSAALLETPRMFQRGYRATVDGAAAAVLRSAEGLVSVPVAAGTHEVSVWFQAPFPLALSYWAALCAWAAVLLMAAANARSPRS